MIQITVLLSIALCVGEPAPREPVRSLGVEGPYVTVNGRPTFLVGQMSPEFTQDRTLDELGEILDVMMVPCGMNLVKGDLGVIDWGAWNNVVNVRRGLEPSVRARRYPWKRTGPSDTTFGGPRFDLDQFDEQYFDRLAEELKLINEHGIVPVVGIFSEHALDHPLHWRGHPFHPDNNVNELGLPARDALPEFFDNDKALVYQEVYVLRLLEALDGVQFILSPFGEVNVAPGHYINRWLRLFEEHEQKTGTEMLVCISGRSEVLDTFAPDPAVDLVDVYCYHGGRYDGREYNVPDGGHGIHQTVRQAWKKYHKPVGKLYFKYGYPYADPKSPWADPSTGTQGGGPETAARDALRAVHDAGGFGIYFKMAWARDRGACLKPDLWSEYIRDFWEETYRTPETETELVKQGQNALVPLRGNPRWLACGSEPVALSGNGLWVLIPDAGMPVAEHNEHASRWGANSNRTSLFSFCHLEELAPWERPGPGTANDGRPKYDLNAFSKVYWDRAAAYVQDCARRGIYPVMQIWGECYVEGGPDPENRWNVHPFNPDNNVNGLTDLPAGMADAGTDGAFYNTDNAPLIAFQDRFTAKALDELGAFPVIWDIGNEVGLDTRISHRWIRHWADFFDAYETSHPGIRLLLTVDANGGHAHYEAVGNLDVVNVHGFRDSQPFTLDGAPDQNPNHSRVHVKRMQAALDRHFLTFNKPLINTRITSDPDRQRRLRDRPGNALETRHILWSYFFGGAHFISFRNHREQSWTAPPLTTEHQQIHLRKFIDSFDFSRCEPRAEGIVDGDDAVVLAEPGRQYAFYAPNGNHFDNRFTADLSEAEDARFQARWFDPRTGDFGAPFAVNGGAFVEFELPTDQDWALLLIATDLRDKGADSR